MITNISAIVSYLCSVNKNGITQTINKWNNNKIKIALTYNVLNVLNSNNVYLYIGQWISNRVSS